MTITIGYWIIPLLISIIVIGYVLLKPPIDNSGFLSGIEIVYELPTAIAISLASWLIWSLLI